MANISSEIAEIQAASRGSEVRQPIVDALNKVNAGVLPAVSSSDAGKFLTVDNDGGWEVRSGGLVPTPTGTKTITQNGTHDVTNYASASVDVEPDLGTKSITQNGTYQASSDSLDGYSEVTVSVPSSSAVLTTKNITQNGTYNASSDNADGYSSVSVNVSGGGGGGCDSSGWFELFTADFGGNYRSGQACSGDYYFVCFFHDNMYSTYTLAGNTYQYAEIGNGQGIASFLGDTREMKNTQGVNSVIQRQSYGMNHSDSGSYCSVVGAWVGCPPDGSIYQNHATGTANSIVMSKAHDTLLVFVGASGQSVGSNTTIQINGVSYTITNMGGMYDNVESMYGAIKIENNSESTITVTFPVSCYNYVSIIGIDE